MDGSCLYHVLPIRHRGVSMLPGVKPPSVFYSGIGLLATEKIGDGYFLLRWTLTTLPVNTVPRGRRLHDNYLTLLPFTHLCLRFTATPRPAQLLHDGLTRFLTAPASRPGSTRSGGTFAGMDLCPLTYAGCTSCRQTSRTRALLPYCRPTAYFLPTPLTGV